MIVVANRIFVAPGQETAFEERFRQRAGLVERAPGFIRHQVLRPLNPEHPYVVMTTWRDRASFEAWVQSPAFRDAHAHTPPADMFRAANQMEMHEVVMTAEAAP